MNKLSLKFVLVALLLISTQGFCAAFDGSVNIRNEAMKSIWVKYDNIDKCIKQIQPGEREIRVQGRFTLAWEIGSLPDCVDLWDRSLTLNLKKSADDPKPDVIEITCNPGACSITKGKELLKGTGSTGDPRNLYISWPK